MKFTVEGADPNSGEERILSIDAKDEGEAEQLARGQGLLVSVVHASRVQDAPPPPPKPADPKLVATIQYRQAAEPAPAEPARPKLPDYPGLRLGGSVLVIIAVLYYLGAILSVLVGLYALLIQPPGINGRETVGGLIMLAYGVGLFTAGALFHAMGSGCEALRDMARHSYIANRIVR